MQRHERGESIVVPIILRPVYFQEAPFGKLQALPPDAKPLKSWPDQDEGFFNVAEGIRRKARELLTKQILDEAKGHYGQKRYQEALAAFERVIIADPDCASAYLYKGYIFKRFAEDAYIKASEHNKLAKQAFDKAAHLGEHPSGAVPLQLPSLSSVKQPVLPKKEPSRDRW